MADMSMAASDRERESHTHTHTHECTRVVSSFRDQAVIYTKIPFKTLSMNPVGRKPKRLIGNGSLVLASKF